MRRRVRRSLSVLLALIFSAAALHHQLTLTPPYPTRFFFKTQDSVSRIEEFRAEVAKERRQRGRRRQSTLDSLNEDEAGEAATPVDVDGSPPVTPTGPVRRQR